MSEPIRTVYRQIRRNLPAHAEVMEMVAEIASGSASALHAPPPADSGSESTYLRIIGDQAEALRKAFNRLYFIKCNVAKFGVDKLKTAEKEFKNAKKTLDFNEASSLSNITRQVERYLETRRYFFCMTTLIQETIPMGLRIYVVVCQFLFVARGGVNDVYS